MDEHGFIFKKSLGQNFLKDENIVNNIVKEAKILPNSLVIEIGPGAGALTKILCQNAKTVLAYEIDSRLDNILNRELKCFSNVEIIYDDFLKRNIKSDIEKYQYDNLYIIANLPYYITTPIINKIISDNILVNKLVIMIQKEVGNRFCATPGMRNYGSLTVFLNYYFKIRKLFYVDRNCFNPKPNVDSVVIELERHVEFKNVIDKDLFFEIVRDSFQYKRKNIRNNLKNYNLMIIDEILHKYNYDLTIRAEQLNLNVFIDIANALVHK